MSLDRRVLSRSTQIRDPHLLGKLVQEIGTLLQIEMAERVVEQLLKQIGRLTQATGEADRPENFNPTYLQFLIDQARELIAEKGYYITTVETLKGLKAALYAHRLKPTGEANEKASLALLEDFLALFKQQAKIVLKALFEELFLYTSGNPTALQKYPFSKLARFFEA